MNAQTVAYQSQNNVQSVEFQVESSAIHELLLSIGIPPNIYGYAYTVYAVQLLLLDKKYHHCITKRLYVDIAEKFDTTPTRVERTISHAINVAWQYGNIDFIDHVVVNCVRPDKGVPTNSVFLTRLFYYNKDASGKLKQGQVHSCPFLLPFLSISFTFIVNYCTIIIKIWKKYFRLIIQQKGDQQYEEKHFISSNISSYYDKLCGLQK